ncbi:MAG: hypothetical protein Q7S34_00200 [bacterium]|nr:hypothetical protein [bacterium]
MDNLFMNSDGKDVSSTARGAGFLARIHSRSLAERRAMFFAVFVITAATVFSFWANHMYRDFGVAFLGGKEAPVASGGAVAAAGDTKDGELKKPFEVAIENVSFLKESLKNLYFDISSGLGAIQKETILDGIPEDGVAGETSGKEPPVAATNIDAAGESQGAPLVSSKNPPLAEKGKAIAKSPTSLSKSAGDVKAVVDAKTVSNDEVVFVVAPESAIKNLDGKEPPLVVYSNTGQNLAVDGVSFPPVQENKEAIKSLVTDAGVFGQGEIAPRIVSIVMTNLAVIWQAFSDFYEYLTQ